MNHRIFIPILLIFTLLLGACASQETKLDVRALADTLLQDVEFRGELVFVDETMTKMLYHIDSFTEAAVYVSGSATAEEIAVFAFADEAAAEQALESVKLRLQDQKDSFAAYLPAEVPAIENAVLLREGIYVILCVSDGTQAEEIITQYIKD